MDTAVVDRVDSSVDTILEEIRRLEPRQGSELFRTIQDEARKLSSGDQDGDWYAAQGIVARRLAKNGGIGLVQQLYDTPYRVDRVVPSPQVQHVIVGGYDEN